MLIEHVVLGAVCARGVTGRAPRADNGPFRSVTAVGLEWASSDTAADGSAKASVLRTAAPRLAPAARPPPPPRPLGAARPLAPASGWRPAHRPAGMCSGSMRRAPRR